MYQVAITAKAAILVVGATPGATRARRFAD